MKRYYKVLVAVAALCACLIAVAACTPRDSEYRQIVECAQKLKSMAKDPESFSVYGECTYAYSYDDIDGYSKEYISIGYRAVNGFGVYLTDTAYFVDGEYVGSYSDYTDDSYEDWSTSRALDFLQAIIIVTEGSYSKSYDADTVNRGLN